MIKFNQAMYASGYEAAEYDINHLGVHSAREILRDSGPVRGNYMLGYATAIGVFLERQSNG